MWVGEHLSPMETLSLSSFVKNNHDVDLYTYSEIDNIPAGVNIVDGNNILPEDMIFQYKDHKSFSAFSNYFRYKLLYEKGGYWVDTDVICIKPFDFKEEYVFCSEEVLPLGNGNSHIGSCVIKLPKGSKFAEHAYNICMSKDKENLKWGEVGPSLVKDTVERFNLDFFVKKPEIFCPIPGCLFYKYFTPENIESETQNSYAYHLWNEMWRRANVDKNNTFHPNSAFERLKEKYL